MELDLKELYKAISHLGIERQLKSHQVLINIGDRSQHLYFIKEGGLSITPCTSKNRKGTCYQFFHTRFSWSGQCFSCVCFWRTFKIYTKNFYQNHAFRGKRFGFKIISQREFLGATIRVFWDKIFNRKE